MKRIREYISALGGRASSVKERVFNGVGARFSGLTSRLTSKTSLLWLGLFVLSVLLLTLFNLPGSLIPELGFLPPATLCALTLAGWFCTLVGVKRGLAITGVAAGLVLPFVQPLLAIPAVLTFAGGASYLVARHGRLNAKVTFATVAGIGVAAALMQTFTTVYIGLGVALLIAAAATYLVRKGFVGAKLTFTLCLPLACALYFVIATLIVPAVHVVTVAGWSYLSPVVALAVAALGTLAVLYRNRLRFRKRTEPVVTPRWRRVAYVLAVLGLWAFVPYTVIANRWEALVSLQMRHDMAPEEVDGLLETVQDRMLPRTTAETYMQNLNNDYMTTVEPPHLQNRADGSGMWWQSAVYNQNRWGRIFGSANRIVAVDADRVASHSENTSNSGFVFSDRSWVVKATFAVRHPFSQVADVSYFQNPDKSWSLLLSYTTKKMTWTLPGPTVMIPSFGGVMEVSQNGIVRDWTVAQAAKRFTGAVLYPTALYRQQCEAYARWRSGWAGAKVLQQKVYEVSEDPSPDATVNPMPYVQHFKDIGLQLMTAFEPKGDKQMALTEVLLADAATGKLRSLQPKAGLIGPRQARLSVRSSDARIDWSHVKKVEPRLVVAPKGIYWLVAIVSHWENEPERHPYVISVLVDAEKNISVADPQHRKELEEWLAKPHDPNELLAQPAGK